MSTANRCLDAGIIAKHLSQVSEVSRVHPLGVRTALRLRNNYRSKMSAVSNSFSEERAAKRMRKGTHSCTECEFELGLSLPALALHVDNMKHLSALKIWCTVVLEEGCSKSIALDANTIQQADDVRRAALCLQVRINAQNALNEVSNASARNPML